MAKLTRSSDNTVLISQLRIADGFWTRLVGLLKDRQLLENEALWIHKCNWIHTLFMSFTIDCVFVDKNLKVTHISPEVKPWRMAGPALRAKSVIEMANGQAKKLNIRIGDQLHVGH